MTEVEINNDTNVSLATSDSAVIVILDSETDIIQTMEQGPPGPQGIPGGPGPQGIPGNTVLYGSADPTPLIGVDENFYINTTTDFMFGPKSGGAWPVGTSLIGPQGPQGAKGDQGNQGPQGTPGVGQPSSALPIIDGTATVGVSTNFSREDHIHPSDVAARAVRFDAAQSLTEAQQVVARQNIYAAPLDAMSFGALFYNGGMDIAQQFGGVLTTIPAATGSFPIDGLHFNNNVGAGTGLQVVQTQNVQDAPPGYTYCFKMTVTTPNAAPVANDVCYFYQVIENWRMYKLAWGTANARPVSVGFWTKIHRPGLYSGSFRCAAAIARSYVFTFTQNVADVWEYKTFTVPGDVTNDWSQGAYFTIALMIGSAYQAPTANVWVTGTGSGYSGVVGTTNTVAATSDVFQITGITITPGLLVPTAANSPLLRRSYDQELTDCRRYYEKSYDPGAPVGGISARGAVGTGQSNVTTNQNIDIYVPFKVSKRTTPSISLYSPVTGAGGMCSNATGPDVAIAVRSGTFSDIGMNGFSVFTLCPSTVYYPYFHFVADARQ